MHNHPIGDPTPSDEDAVATQEFARNVPGFQGHVIINSERYGFLDAAGPRPVDEYEVHDLPVEDRLLVPSIPNRILGQRLDYPSSAVRLFQESRIQAEGAPVLFFLMGLRVRAVVTPDPVTFRHPAIAAVMIQEQMRLLGATRVVSTGPWSLGPEVYQSAVTLVGQGILADHIVLPEGRYEPLSVRASLRAARVHLPEWAPMFRRPGRAVSLRQPEERQEEEPAVDIAAHLDTLARMVLGQHPEDYPAWAEVMRRWVSPAYHGMLPTVYARVTGAAPAGGVGVTPPETSAAPPRPGVVQPGLPGTTVAGEGTSEQPRRAANINLDKWETVEDVKVLMEDLAAQNREGIETQRRRVRTWEQTIEAARRSGMTAEQILATRPGDIWNAEELQAARQIVVAAAEDLYRAQARSSAPNAGPEDLATFVQKLQRFRALMQALTGLTAEAGRVLNQQKIKVRALEEWRRIMEGFGGETLTREVAERLGKTPPENLAAVAATVRAATAPDALDKFYWLWLNGLLSGPHTHAINMTATAALMAVRMGPERVVAAGIDLGVATFTGRPRERFASEAMAEIYALGRGLTEGYLAMRESWRTEVPSTAIPGFAHEGALARSRPIKGRAGRVFGTPTRALMAEDELMKATAYRTALHALAVRAAAREGLSGDAMWARADEIAREASAVPTPEAWTGLVDEAIKEARARTLHDEAGPFIKALIRFRDTRTPIGRATLPWIIPFVRIVSRIAAQAGHYSPLQAVWIASKELGYRKARREWERAYGPGTGGGGAGGPGGPQPPLPGVPEPVPLPPEPPFRGGGRADQWAKFVLGTVAVALWAWAVEEGYVTGGGSDDPGLARVGARSRPKYAIRTPWGSLEGYHRLAPLGLVLGATADITESLSDKVKGGNFNLVSKMLASVIDNLVKMNMMLGVNELANLLQDAYRYGERWTTQTVGSFVPNIFAQAAQIFDPTQRSAQGVEEGVYRRVPGASQTLLPRRDVAGEPIERGTGERLSRVFLPLNLVPHRDDPIARELERIGIGLNRPGRTLGKMALTPEERDAYEEAAGRRAWTALDALFARDDYARAPMLTQRRLAQDAVRLARRAAQDDFLRDLSRGERKERRDDEAVKRLPPAVRETIELERP